MSHLRPEGDRNALLDLHFDEDEPRSRARTRAHLETCARCREYLGALDEVDRKLRSWTDEPVPAYLADRVFARVARSVQVSAPRAERRAPALLALLPLMAVLVAGGRALADRLGALASWSQIAQWPGVALLGTSGVTVVLLLLGGGFLTLAIAPALMLESQRGRRPSLA